MAVLTSFYPDWRSLAVHESSPAGRGVSAKLQAECAGYVPSQFDAAIPVGERHPHLHYVSQDLEAQSFPDGCFDLVIAQDVFEHLFRPDLAIREIRRTLRPGGACLMTAPLVRKGQPSRRRASRMDGGVVHHQEPLYHANPVDETGSLVTIDWGFDIADYLSEHSGMTTTIHYFDDRSRGLQAELLEVVVCRRSQAPSLRGLCAPGR